MNYLFRSQVLMRSACVLALHAGEEYGAEDLAKVVGADRSSVVKAIQYLERDGLVRHRAVGKKNLYSVVTDHPFFPEIRSIALKTFGGSQAILETIRSDSNVVFAAIFGSFARGEERRSSDIDVLMVIKDRGADEEDYRLATAMAGVSARIARSVNPTVYKQSEFARLLKTRNATTLAIVDSPMIVLKGDLSHVEA